MGKPKVRFKGYTDDWEQRKVSEIAIEKLSNGIMNNQSDDETEVKHINVINMYDTDKIHPEKLTFSNYDEEAVKKCNVGFGDIFLTRSSLKPEGIAEANVLLDSGRFVYDDHLIRLKVNKEKYDPFFVKLNLSGNAFKRQFIVRAKTTAFTTIGQEDISECLGFFPKKEEQQQIGECFMTLDHLITLHQRKCENAQKLKKYMLQKMFPKNGTNVPEIRFEGFKDAWEQRKFADFTWDAGKRNREDLDLEPYAITNEHGFIRQCDAHDDFGYMKDTDRKAYNIVQPNSFAYNPARINVGSIGYYKGVENVIVSSLYEVFQTDNYVNDRFLWHWFKSDEFPRWIERLQEGSVRLYFYYDKLCECRLYMPSLEEQEKIASFLDALDHLITLHQHKCEELKNIKKFMLQNMFVQEK